MVGSASHSLLMSSGALGLDLDSGPTPEDRRPQGRTVLMPLVMGAAQHEALLDQAEAEGVDYPTVLRRALRLYMHAAALRDEAEQ